jgi:hypothetical protein
VVAHERGARGGAVAREDVDDARRETRLDDELRQVQPRQRRLLRHLQHHAVARRQRGGQLPGCAVEA